MADRGALQHCVRSKTHTTKRGNTGYIACFSLLEGLTHPYKGRRLSEEAHMVVRCPGGSIFVCPLVDVRLHASSVDACLVQVVVGTCSGSKSIDRVFKECNVSTNVQQFLQQQQLLLLLLQKETQGSHSMQGCVTNAQLHRGNCENA